MDKMTVRDARHDEAAFIVQMIRHMVVDMASYGGNTPATDDAAWKKLRSPLPVSSREIMSNMWLLNRPMEGRLELQEPS